MRRRDTSALEGVKPSVLAGSMPSFGGVRCRLDARCSNRNPLANLKNLSPITPKGQKQYSIGEAKTDCLTSGSEFVLNVFAAIRNRLDSTVRFVTSESCAKAPDPGWDWAPCFWPSRRSEVYFGAWAASRAKTIFAMLIASCSLKRWVQVAASTC
jgi:hypothetical protein